SLRRCPNRKLLPIRSSITRSCPRPSDRECLANNRSDRALLFRDRYCDVRRMRMLLPARRDRPQIVLRPKQNPLMEGDEMGFVYAEIELINSVDLRWQRRGHLEEDQIKRVRVTALADTGAYNLVISERVREQLDLAILEERVARLADDSECNVKVAGPVEIRFENRRTTTDALVFPGDVEVLLGSIP